MNTQTFDKFAGYYTSSDKFSCPGSPEMTNCDIDLNDNIIKTEGYTRIAPQVSTALTSHVTVTDFTDNPGYETVVWITDASSYLSVSMPVVLYDNGSVHDGHAFNVDNVTSAYVTFSGFQYLMAGPAKLDISMAYLKGFVTISTPVSAIECQGAYYDSEDDRVYSFLANKTDSKSYLVYADKDVANWRFVEGSSTALATAFGVTNNAWFVKYGSSIIFTKGETQGNTISLVSSGGLFTLNASGQIVLYGAANNPTGKVVEIHKERVCVGNITALGGVTQNGESWVIMSKFLPEKTDSVYTISGITFETGTAKILNASAVLSVGDTIYISGTVMSGTNDFDKHLYSVVGVSGTVPFVYYNNVNGIGWSSGGSIVLRGPTWSPATYDDAIMGAGIFRCDDNENDHVIQLKSSFGALAILRRENPYIFTGAIESGNQTLARPLNVKYGAYSPHAFVTAGGTWFMSQYGLSKIEGTTIKTNSTALDNIVDISVSEPIKPDIDSVSDKSKLILHGTNRFMIIHNPDDNYSYVLDTLKGNYFRWGDRLVDRFVNIGADTYAIYKYFIFKLNDGYQIWNLLYYGLRDMVSNYFTKVLDQGDMLSSKIYQVLYALIEGAPTSTATNTLTINLYYNGKRSAGYSFSFDIKTGALVTWNTLTSDAASTWNTVTTNGTVTWNSLTGVLTNMLEKRKYRIGSGREVQIELQHSDNSSFKVSRLLLGYDLLDVTLRQT